MGHDKNFQQTVATQPVTHHSKDELPESRYTSPELESLQDEVTRHPVHHHRGERSRAHRIFARCMDYSTLIIVLLVVTGLSICMLYGLLFRE